MSFFGKRLASSPLQKDDKLRRVGSDEDNLNMSSDSVEISGQKGQNQKVLAETIMMKVNESVSEALSILQPTAGDEDPMTKTLMKAVPVIAAAVSMAVSESLKVVFGEMEGKLIAANERAATAREEKLFAAVRTLTYENDRLQQYSRRESVRVWGVPQADDETKEAVEEKVLKVFKDAGADIKREDIAVAHRAGKKPARGSRPILVKFVSRRTRNLVMAEKKNLKGKANYERVFINDDLTPLRARLLGYVKKIPAVEKAYTVDGRIHCHLRSPVGLPPNQRPKPVIVETPDDLFRLGVTSVDYQELGLQYLAE
jgi:hypothetical protein